MTVTCSPNGGDHGVAVGRRPAVMESIASLVMKVNETVSGCVLLTRKTTVWTPHFDMRKCYLVAPFFM